MKVPGTPKKPLFHLAFFAFLAACREPDYGQNHTVPQDNMVTQNNTNNQADTADAAVAFSIPKEAMVQDEQGVRKKLAELMVTNNTFVIRVTNKHPEESRHIVLYRSAYLTDRYPKTDSIIILTDELPADTGPAGSWSQRLNMAANKVRVFKIEKNLMPAALERRRRAYVFFLNTQLQARSVYMPAPNSMYLSPTNYYFAGAAIKLRRIQKEPPQEQQEQASNTAPQPTNRSSGNILFFTRWTAKVGDRTVRETYYEEFDFYNKGDDPLVINNIINNWDGDHCCVYVPETPVKPGKRCKIRIYYRPRWSGTFRNKIVLYTNMSSDPLTFIISGKAVKNADIEGVSWWETQKKSMFIGYTRYKRF